MADHYSDLGTRGDGRYRVIDEDGTVRGLVALVWPTEAKEDPDAATRQATGALTRLVSMGLPVRPDGRDCFYDYCEVVNFLTREGVEGRDSTLMDRILLRRRNQFVGTMGLDRPLPSGSGEHDPRRYVMNFRREFNLEGDVPGRSARLRLPLPYEDPAQRDITVELVEAPENVRTTRGPGFLEFRWPVPAESAIVAVEVRYKFTAHRQTFTAARGLAQPVELSAAERDLYTRPKEGLIMVTPSVLDLASSLARVTDDPWAMAEAFWEFFFDRMKSGSIHHDELDTVDPLGDLVRRGWFNCLAGTALMVGLLRARGIPARVVQGIMLHDGSVHLWAEFYSPGHGWVPLDLTSWYPSGGRLDAVPWGRLFLGRMDYRLKFQCFPRWVVGPVGVRLPVSWSMRYAETPGKVEVSCYDSESSRLIFRDLMDFSCSSTAGLSPSPSTGARR